MPSHFDISKRSMAALDKLKVPLILSAVSRSYSCLFTKFYLFFRIVQGPEDLACGSSKSQGRIPFHSALRFCTIPWTSRNLRRGPWLFSAMYSKTVWPSPRMKLLHHLSKVSLDLLDVIIDLSGLTLRNLPRKKPSQTKRQMIPARRSNDIPQDSGRRRSFLEWNDTLIITWGWKQKPNLT